MHLDIPPCIPDAWVQSVKKFKFFSLSNLRSFFLLNTLIFAMFINPVLRCSEFDRHWVPKNCNLILDKVELSINTWENVCFKKFFHLFLLYISLKFSTILSLVLFLISYMKYYGCNKKHLKSIWTRKYLKNG